METTSHDVHTLFEQLGLPSDPSAIARFVEAHPVDEAIPIDEAPFWTPSQAAFLREALEEDAAWAEPVDELSARLRRGGGQMSH